MFHDTARHRAGSFVARLRLDPGRRTAVSVGVVAVAVALVTGVWVWSARPHREPSSIASAAGVPSTRSAAAGQSAAPGAALSPPDSRGGSPASAGVVVDVAGKVRRPGLVRLPGGARAYDAVAAAGGALPGVSLDSINLAARVVDGQQILVGAPALPSSAGSGPAGTSARAAPVDLNTANADQLQSLPGVGPVLAQHIMDWRSAHGSFSSVDQLGQVTGIGPAKFASLKALVTV